MINGRNRVCEKTLYVYVVEDEEEEYYEYWGDLHTQN